jgi:tubulin beta
MHIQADQCGNQKGTQFLEMVCDEHGIGGSGEYYGDSDAHLDHINVFYYETLCGKYMPRAVLFDLEPGVIGAVRASPLGALFRPGNLVNQNAGAGRNLAKGHNIQLGTIYA